MSSKNKNKVTQTNKIEPWSAAQPALRDVLNTAQEMGVEGFKVNPYEGQRVADYSANTQAGIDSLAATGNNAITPAAQSALLSTLNMDDSYRDFDNIKASVADDVKANLAGMFSGGGMGNSLAQVNAGIGMADAMGRLEYDAYNEAQARKMQALGMAPTISNMARADAGALMTAGGLEDAMAQRKIDADMAEYYEREGADAQALQQYASIASGIGGLGSTGTQTAPGQSGLSQIAGAASQGLGTYGALAGIGMANPIAIGGGILAGIAGL